MAVKWFDLSRFGAALKVVPNSPLRGVSLTCLEIFDQSLFTSGWKLDGSLEGDRAKHEAWRQARSALGFGAVPVTVREPQGEGLPDRVSWRQFSPQLKFTLRDIQALVPGVEASDLREMDEKEIALAAEAGIGMSEAWQQFVFDVLSKEGKGVWTPKVNPFDKPWAEAETFTEFRAKSQAEEDRSPFFAHRGVAIFGQFDRLLEEANYRTNALVPFYVDEGSAFADGWKPDELERVDLPYALPLWVSRSGQIQALRDIRYAPEVMQMEPKSYFGRVPDGLVVAALRKTQSLIPMVRGHVEQWARWAADPASLEMPDLFWGSITEIASEHAEVLEKHPSLAGAGNLELILDGKHAQRNGTYRARPLLEMDQNTMFGLTQLCARYVPMSGDERGVLQGALTKLLARSHELMAAHAQALARESLQEVTSAVRGEASADINAQADKKTNPPPQQTTDKVRHEDAGEKIGGARKDYAKRAMVYEDLELMNDAERDIYVVKKNVWGPLNYQQMREDGVSAEAALAIKTIKDKLLTAPDRHKRSRVRIDDPDAQYIEAIALVRDHLADIKTMDEVREAIKTLYDLGNRDHEGNPTNYIYGGSPLQIQWGKDVCDMFFDGKDGYTPAKISREIRRKINIFGREPTEDEQWRSMIKPKREKSQEQVAEEKTKAEIDRELHRPHLARVQRKGEDWRAGRDIVADDLIEHFGFRGVEFGNWLPQDERQQVLNMAFDSLCDLADSLSLPPKGLSLNGTLACAFGSRGRGGKNAALAHFEPARMVINLTRMNGAGSLAHEWMHALDWHLGADKGANGAFLSEAELGSATAMGRLSGRMHKRFATEEEIVEAATAKARRGLSNTLSWLYGQPENVRHQMVDVIEGLYEEARGLFYDRAVQVINAGMKADPGRFAQTGFNHVGAVGYEMSLRQADEAYERIKGKCTVKTAMTKVKAKVEPNLNFMMVNLAKACTAQALIDLKVAAPKAFCAGENAKPSQFYVQATKLDKIRAGAYWATTRELFARAGAAYVSDKVAQRGHQSDYLVYGADEGRYADHAIGNPNPTGEDREALAEHFDELIAEYRLACLKEAEQEAVAEP